MPYITRGRRATLNAKWGRAQTAGELHFVIARLLNGYLKWGGNNGLSYQKINDVMGVLACAQQEVYRRVAVDYEQQKCTENGDVFDV